MIEIKIMTERDRTMVKEWWKTIYDVDHNMRDYPKNTSYILFDNQVPCYAICLQAIVGGESGYLEGFIRSPEHTSQHDLSRQLVKHAETEATKLGIKQLVALGLTEKLVGRYVELGYTSLSMVRFTWKELSCQPQ